MSFNCKLVILYKIKQMELTYKVQNLKCGGCANTIVKKLSTIEHINKVEVEQESSTVRLVVDNNEMDDVVKKAFLNLGYPVVGDKNAFSSKAKSFLSCANGKINK